MVQLKKTTYYKCITKMNDNLSTKSTIGDEDRC